MRPIKTYAVRVEGFTEPVLYSARSASKARAACYRGYSAVYDATTFKQFLKISTIRVVPNRPGIGERIMVAGAPATRCLGNMPGGTYFMRDDSDVILSAHESEVEPMPAAQAA